MTAEFKSEWSLQIKDSGAWRTIIKIPVDDLARAKQLGTELAFLSANSKVVLRILESRKGHEGRVWSYCEPVNSWQWRDIQHER